ncbi:hypothetical protein LTR66_008960 [Elasticomyces elasticus]|nr:hypothetical protein LTR66_008960 [Elasticomyces elasticus]
MTFDRENSCSTSGANAYFRCIVGIADIVDVEEEVLRLILRTANCRMPRWKPWRFEKLVDEYEEQRRIEKRHEQRQRQSDDALAEKEIIKMMRKKLGTKEDLEARMARHAQLTKAAKMIIVCNHFMENYIGFVNGLATSDEPVSREQGAWINRLHAAVVANLDAAVRWQITYPASKAYQRSIKLKCQPDDVTLMRLVDLYNYEVRAECDKKAECYKRSKKEPDIVEGTAAAESSADGPTEAAG